MLRRLWSKIGLGAFLFWMWTSHSRLAFLLREEAGAVGDVKIAYAASANEATVTALNSLATSSTWIAGWGGTIIDNTSNLFVDFRITAKITVGNAPTAGEIRLYLIGMLDDSTWPGAAAGTIGTVGAVTPGANASVRDAICRLGAATTTLATASVAYYLDCPSVAQVFGGNLPKKFVVFITHNTVQALAAAGQQVTSVGVYANVAQT